MVKKCLDKVGLEIIKRGPKSFPCSKQPGKFLHAEGGNGNIPLLQAFDQFPASRSGKGLEGNNGDRMFAILEATGKMDQRTFSTAGFQFGNDKACSHGIVAG